jgi:hypothetical protein
MSGWSFSLTSSRRRTGYRRHAHQRLRSLSPGFLSGNSFIARGQTARGLPIMLVVGRPSGIADGQFLSP